MTRFDLHILGCGSAVSTMRHQPSCQVLNIRDNLMMIDCGEGAQLAMRRERLKFSRLGHIFISHLHGDHCFGLPGLISTMALLGHTGVLTIHTFPDGRNILNGILNYFCRDMPFTVECNIITPDMDVIYEDNAVEVRSIPLSHGIPAVGFLFVEKPKLPHINGEMAKFYEIPHYMLQGIKEGADYVLPDGQVVPNERLVTPAEPSTSYAYCSDTKYSERVIERVRGVKWLYHESTYADDKEKSSRRWGHSTARQAGRVAREADVENLILGHYSQQYLDETVLLDQAKEEFANTILSHEGLVVDLNGKL